MQLVVKIHGPKSLMLSVFQSTARSYPLANVEVGDGDTVRADVNMGLKVVLSDRSIRVLGIDAPETHTKRLLEKKAGLIVTEWLRQRIGENTVTLRTGKDETDKYGRVFGALFIGDVNLCEELIELGYAHRYDGGTKASWTVDELNQIVEGTKS